MYGKIIKQERLANKLTQKELADKLGISQNNLSKYENEQLDLSTEMTVRICNALNISADYLLGIRHE